MSKIVVLVNDVHLLKASQSSAAIVHGWAMRGHEVYLGQVGDLSWGISDAPHLWAYPTMQGDGSAEWLRTIVAQSAVSIELTDVDLIWVRTNPAKDKDRGWAHEVLLDLLSWVESRGVLVLNPPSMLHQASSKMYLQSFPAEVRPKSLISHRAQDIAEFVRAQTKPCILKPLKGTGGSSVFIVRPEDRSNLNQIIEVISQQDFVIAQEYIEEAHIGDARVLLVNGEVLRVDGAPAIVARLRQGDDVRSNVAVGGKPASVELSPQMQRVIDLVSPKLKADGVFLAGLDIIGSKIVEINVFSPGGFQDAGVFANRDFIQGLLVAAEKMLEKH
jgi:glutathione synthase